MQDIGEGRSALLCKTDKLDCCHIPPNRYGQFYYPDGGQVPIRAEQQGFYRNRGEQLIRLNKRKGMESPPGKYRCEIPTAAGEVASIYVTLTM